MHCDVLVGGRDRDYFRALVEFLMNSKNNQFNMTVMESFEDLSTFFADDRYSLYLLEESLLNLAEEVGLPPANRCLIMTEVMTAIDTGELTPVLKYQRVSAIEKLMLRTVANSSDKEKVMPASAGSSLVGFFSPSGGLGCSVLAQMYCCQKVTKGYRVLFVGLDYFRGGDLLFHSIQQQNMSDYMVHMLSGKNWLMGLEDKVAVDGATGVHYLRSVNHQKDLSDFDGQQWVAWLAYIKRLSDYDYIVIDPGRQPYDVLAGMLNRCGHRVYIAGADELGQHKWQTFIKDLKDIGHESLLEKKTLLVRQRGLQKGVPDDCDGVLTDDWELFRKGRDGSLQINPHSQTYRQVEAVLNHV